MPVRLRQELQGLPWGAGIVALSCGIRECFATCCPCSSVSASLLCSSTNVFTATIFRRPPKSKKVGQLPSLRQFQFFDPTASTVERPQPNYGRLDFVRTNCLAASCKISATLIQSTPSRKICLASSSAIVWAASVQYLI